MPFFGFHTPSESLKERFLKEYVGWCVAPRRNEVLGSLSLPDIVYDRQRSLSLPASYKIDRSSSYDFLEAIIGDFAIYLIDQYFNDLLSYDSSFSVLTKEEYFLYEFEHYLSKKISNLEFAGRTLAIEEDRVNYGSWGLSQNYSAKHHLTDNGVLFNKILYIVTIACSKSYNILRIHGNYHPEIVKEYIDTRIISVSRG